MWKLGRFEINLRRKLTACTQRTDVRTKLPTKLVSRKPASWVACNTCTFKATGVIVVWKVVGCPVQGVCISVWVVDCGRSFGQSQLELCTQINASDLAVTMTSRSLRYLFVFFDNKRWMFSKFSQLRFLAQPLVLRVIPLYLVNIYLRKLSYNFIGLLWYTLGCRAVFVCMVNFNASLLCFTLKLVNICLLSTDSV